LQALHKRRDPELGVWISGRHTRENDDAPYPCILLRSRRNRPRRRAAYQPNDPAPA
jgi:hypothetical protein